MRTSYEVDREVQPDPGACVCSGPRDRGPDVLPFPPARCARSRTPAGPPDDGSDALRARLHYTPDQTAARDPAGAPAHLSSPDGPGLCRDRELQLSAGHVSRLRLQRGDAQSHQPARPRGRLGGRRHQQFSQPRRFDRIGGRARYADGPGPLPGASDPRAASLPGVPRPAKARSGSHDPALRIGQRLRMAEERDHRSADRLGTRGASDPHGGPGIPQLRLVGRRRSSWHAWCCWISRCCSWWCGRWCGCPRWRTRSAWASSTFPKFRCAAATRSRRCRLRSRGCGGAWNGL